MQDHPAAGVALLDIDGAIGEGGGQILRSSLDLSMCTGRPFALTRIRAGRRKPGLMRQHLSCVRAAAEVCGAEVQGAELGSTSLTFVPGSVRAADRSFNVGSAGSCTLVLQTVWPALMRADAPSRLKLGGGTHNPLAPPFHFIERCYAPLLRRLGAPVDMRLHRMGFYLAGGGQIEAVIWPARDTLQPFDLRERGALVDAHAECFAPALHRSIPRRELDPLGAGLGWDADQLREVPVPRDEGPGNALLATLVHEHVTEVCTAFGQKDISAEQVARDLLREVRAWQASDAALGPHLADQWALPLALAVHDRGGQASYTCTELTPHAMTNFDVIERFLPVTFETGGEGVRWEVRVKAVR